MEIATIIFQTLPTHMLPHYSFARGVFGHSRPWLSPLAASGAALLLGGALLRANTYRELGRFFRFDISIQDDHKLIKTGPYAFVRHPSYCGVLLYTIGWFLWTFSAGSWLRESGVLNNVFVIVLLVIYITGCILPSSIVTLSRMHKEDEALRNEFGHEWELWAQEVPYSVVPGLY